MLFERRSPAWAAVLAATAALAVAGCGSSDDEGGRDSGGSRPTGADSSGKSSGTSGGGQKAAAPSTIDWPEPQPAVEERTGGSKTPIRIAILSDCKGAFGTFEGQTIAGAVAALSQFAGARPKDPKNPRAGWTGGAIADHPLELAGIGCSDDRADTAIRETRRLMEQEDADILIGPLSGDESIAVANYAKSHPDKTFVDGAAGAQDTTLKVQAPNFFRFNGDGAQWNAGLGQIAYNQLGWKTAVVVADDYSFGWTSAAGFIADFCAAGGDVVQRVFPPLNTTDYSSYAQQAQPSADGTFVAVGGAGLIPFLKAYEQSHGPIDPTKFMGNLFWGTPGQFEALGPRVADVYIGSAGTAGDLDTEGAKDYANNIIGKWFEEIPPAGEAAPQAPSTFTYGYYLNTWGLIEGLEAVKGDISGGQKKLQEALAKVTLPAPYGEVKLDENRQAVFTNFNQQLYMNGDKLAVKTVAAIPDVSQEFGGTFSESTPAPGRKSPGCEQRDLPWAGKVQQVETVQ